MPASADNGKTRTAPRDYFEALRASTHPLSDDEKKIALAEIARRYAWHDKERREANPLRLLTIARVRELELLFADNYGLYLPDNDAGWDDFIVIANHLAHFGGTAERNVARIVEWAAIWAPAFPTDRVTDRAKLIAANPLKWKADKLAWRLGLTMAQRTRLKIKTIGAIDVKREDRPVWLREHHRQRKEAERRAKSVKPREEYLANSDSAKKCWEVLGMSRATWYRKGKPMPETEPAHDTPRETGPADYIDRLRPAGPVSPTARLVEGEAVIECAPTLDGQRLGDEALGDGQANRSSTLHPALSPPAAPLPCEDSQRFNPWTGPLPQPLGCHMTGWELPPVGPASIILNLPRLGDGFGRIPIDQPWAQPMRVFAAARRALRVAA